MDGLLADLPALVSLGPPLALVVVMARLWWVDRRDLRAELARERKRNRELHADLDAERDRRRAAEDRR